MYRILSVILFALFLFVHAVVFAQQPQIGWSKVYGQPSVARGLDIKATPDGNFMVLNLANPIDTALPCNKGMADVWLFKMDPAGNILWEKCYGGSDVDGTGGTIEPTPDGGYIFETLTSSSDGDVSGYHGGKDVWIVKLDSAGNIEWERCFGGGGTDSPYSLIATSDTGCVFVASTNSSVGGDIPYRYGGPFDDDAWFVKLDKNGDIVLNKIYGGTGKDLFSGVIQLGDSYYVVGHSNSPDGDLAGKDVQGDDGWLLKLNPNGEILMNKVYGQNTGEVFEKIIFDNDSLVIGGGAGGEQFPLEHGYYHGWLDYWIVKMDTNGNLAWQGLYGGSYTDSFVDIYEAPFESGYYVIGNSNSADGDISNHHGPGGMGTILLDYWVIKLDRNGVLLWEISLGGTGEDAGYAQVVEFGFGLHAGLTGSNDFDVTNPFSPNLQTWVLKLDDFNAVNEINSAQYSMHVFPNPASDQTTIRFSTDFSSDNNELRLTDVSGHIVWSCIIPDDFTSFTIPVDQLSSGIYLLQLKSDDQLLEMQKLVVSR